MSSEIKLDSEIFQKRAKKFLRYFKDSPPELNGYEAVLSLVGARDGELSYQKSIALQVLQRQKPIFNSSTCFYRIGGLDMI